MELAVLLSIQPQWCEKIASGEKTVEVRKTAPKIGIPFMCYMYCTKNGRPLVYAEPTPYNTDPLLHRTYGWNRKRADEIFGIWNGKVIGEFVCDWVLEITPHCDIDGYINQYIHKYPAILGDDCLSFEQMLAYLGNKKGFDWHISELKIYEKPKMLGEFITPSGTGGVSGNHYLYRPPQSWCYVEELK